MKKSFGTLTDMKPEDLDETRRLYSGINNMAQRLDEQMSQSRTVCDIFTESGEVLRAKLRDYCERLIFRDPVGQSKKTEELLWRRGFYNVIATAKKLRKGNTWNSDEKALIYVHLSVAVGFYHNFILKLHHEYNLDLVGIVDFVYSNDEEEISQRDNERGTKIHSKEVRQCALRLIHRSLICLGDVARYKLDLVPHWNSNITERYYKMAIIMNPNVGMPHNQLGTMAGNNNYGLDAVYHYIRCLLCPESFEGAEGNFNRIIISCSFTGNQEDPLHRCIARLLSLLQLWGSGSPNSNQTNQACQDFINDIEICLAVKSCRCKNKQAQAPGIADNIEEYLKNVNEEPLDYLTQDMVFKIVGICFMTIVKLQRKGSSDVHGVIAVTLAIFSQLLQVTIEHLQQSVIDVSIPNGQEYSGAEILDLISAGQNSDFKMNETETNITDRQNCRGYIADSNQNGKFLRIEKLDDEVKVVSNGTKKSKRKSKSLLMQLRRRRRRRLYSSDSDTSDLEGHTLGSSSDEMNSDISENEEDASSDDIVLSDDALSDDLSDAESANTSIEQNVAATGNDDSKTQINNLISVNDEDRPKSDNVDVADSEKDKANSKNTDKDSVENSDSAMTSVTNVNSSSNCKENSRPVNPDAVAHVVQLKKQNLDPNEILKILQNTQMLPSIKVCCDWLTSHPDIIRSCSKSSRILLKRITTFLNLINVDAQILLNSSDSSSAFPNLSVKNLDKAVQAVPLPEDIDLKGVKILDAAQKKLNWAIFRKFKMNMKEETLLRVLKLNQFGKFLCSVASCSVTYQKDKKLFETSNIIDFVFAEKTSHIRNNAINVDHPRGKLMSHMGKLWLKAEVSALENKLQSRLISPFLVPDHEALYKHTGALKRLVFSKKFIIVIPSVVVSALDEVKRSSSHAREATRWLETQLRKGSRFLRAQRPNERLAVPLVKRPKPKDKDAWLYFQIIECCHYLTNQTKVALTSDVEVPVVTLLTGRGTNDQRISNFSPVGIAKSAGINIEHIESFHSKWKASSKSHG